MYTEYVNTPIHFIIIIISISFSVWVIQYLSFIEFLRKFCVYDEIFDKVYYVRKN